MLEWFRRAHRVALEERNLTLFLIVLVGVVFLAFPLAEARAIHRGTLQGCLTLLLLSGVLVMSAQPRMTLLAAVFAGAVILVRWAAHLRPEGRLGQVDALLAFAFFFWLTSVMIYRVFREGAVTTHRIYGAIAVYLLLSLDFAFAFEVILDRDPQALHFAVESDRESPVARLVYFSLATLTTIGYGDVLPVNPLARSLAMLEGLVGQLFPAVLLARLVALELEQRRNGSTVHAADRARPAPVGGGS